MYQPQSLLEAYHSIYQEPEYLNEEYLSEEDEYFYNIVQFLLDEGYTEDDILELTEQENFVEIVHLIEDERQLELLKKTKSGYEARSMTPAATRKQKGVPVEGPRKETQEPTRKQEAPEGQLSLNLSGKKPSRSLPSARQASAQERRVTPKSRKGITRNTSAREYPGNETSKSGKIKKRLGELEAEVDKNWETHKKENEFQMPSKTLVRKAKDAYAAGVERHQKATKTAGEVLGGIGRYFAAHQKAKVARAGGRDISSKTQERYARQQAFKGIKEDYFDIVADYLLENFEFYSQEHFYETMASLSEELIDEIVEGYKPLPKEKIERKIDKVQGNLVNLYKGNERPTIKDKDDYGVEHEMLGDRANTGKILKQQQRFSKLSNTLASHNPFAGPLKRHRNQQAGLRKGLRQNPPYQPPGKPKNNVYPFRRKVEEEYLDYILDYLLENYEFESEQHLYDVIASLDEETIYDILAETAEKGHPDIKGQEDFQRHVEAEMARRRAAREKKAQPREREEKVGGVGSSIMDKNKIRRTSGRAEYSREEEPQQTQPKKGIQWKKPSL